MKTIPTYYQTQQLISGTMETIARDAEHLGAKHGISGAEGLSSLKDCIDPILRAYNKLIISAYQSLMNFSANSPEKAEEERTNLMDRIEDLKKENRLDSHHLDAKGKPWGIIGRLTLWTFLSMLVVIADWAIMASVLQLYMPSLLFSIVLAVGIGVALYLLPVLSLVQASKATNPIRRKWIIWRSFLLSFGIFLLLLVARSQFETESGNEQTTFAMVFFLALNCLFFVICHYLAKFFLLPVIPRLKEVWEYFRAKRQIKNREAEIARLERQVSACNRDEELYEQARDQALLNEEQIARGYMECISIYREAFRSKMRSAVPAFLSENPPEPDFILRGKTVTSSHTPFRGVRSRIGYVLILFALSGFYSCSLIQDKPTYFISYLRDLTTRDTLRITASQLITFTGLSADANTGAELCLSSISAKTYPAFHRLFLPSTSTLNSNSIKRPDILRDFLFQVDSVLERMGEPHKEDITEKSLVFLQLSRMLFEYESSEHSSSGVILLQSDLMENSPVISSYKEPFQTEQAIEVLKANYPPPALSKPLRVVVVHDPDLINQDRFGQMLDILKGYLSDIPSVHIEVVPTLA